MDISSQLNLSTDIFFQQLKENQGAIDAAWSHITKTIDNALISQDYPALLNLIPYIEQGEGTLAYEHIVESRRVLRILHIIQLELKYQKAPFSLHCTTMDSLMEKYMLALFAFRRLQFGLSEASMEEAAGWLLSSRLSVFSVYVITQEDLTSPTNSFYHAITEIFTGYWDNDDKKLFLSLTGEN